MKTKPLVKEFIRFGVVGVLATALHYGIYYFLQSFINVNVAYTTGYVISFIVNFYHNDQIGLFEKDMPAEGYLLVGRRDFEGFKPKYESEYTFEEVYQSTKRGCDIRDIIYLYRFKRK